VLYRFLSNGATYVNEKYAQVPRSITGDTTTKKEYDSMRRKLWSFVDHKGGKQWAGWRSMPTLVKLLAWPGARQSAARQCKEFFAWGLSHNARLLHTDFWAAYAAVLPSVFERCRGEETGKTGYVERFNSTLRISRLVRKPCLSKSLENHIGAIYFVHYYNHHYLFSTTNLFLQYRKEMLSELKAITSSSTLCLR